MTLVLAAFSLPAGANQEYVTYEGFITKAKNYQVWSIGGDDGGPEHIFEYEDIPAVAGAIVAGNKVPVVMENYLYGTVYNGNYVNLTFFVGDEMLLEYPDFANEFELQLPMDSKGKKLHATAHSSQESPAYQETNATFDYGVIGAAGFATTPTPTLSGTACVGNTLSANPGSWKPEGSRLSYQWLRSGQPIVGATRATYTIQASDLGKSISVRVTGSLGSAAPVAKQSASKLVGECLIPATKAPILVGGKTTDSTLVSKLVVPAGVSASYQWLRSGKSIKGATRSSYKLTAADVGKRIQSRVSLTKKGYKGRLLTSASVSVSKATIKNTKRASIAGQKSYGQTLKVSAGKYSASPTTFGYQWHRNGKKIKGATKGSLKMSAADIGRNISVTVRASRPGYHSTSSTTTASKISPGKIVPKSLPKISGKAKSGSVLSVSNGTWSPQASTYSYQWYRNGIKIKAANKRTYKVVTADRGRKISARVYVARKNHTKASAASKSVYVVKPTEKPKPKPKPPVNRAPSGGYANCTAVRNAGAAPIYYGDPGYHSRLDRDGDGVGCE